MNRTPEQDAEVIETLMALRVEVIAVTKQVSGTDAAGMPFTTFYCEANPKSLAIDYAIGVIKATQP